MEIFNIDNCKLSPLAGNCKPASQNNFSSRADTFSLNLAAKVLFSLSSFVVIHITARSLHFISSFRSTTVWPVSAAIVISSENSERKKRTLSRKKDLPSIKYFNQMRRNEKNGLCQKTAPWYKLFFMSRLQIFLHVAPSNFKSVL